VKEEKKGEQQKYALHLLCTYVGGSTAGAGAGGAGSYVNDVSAVTGGGSTTVQKAWKGNSAANAKQMCRRLMLSKISSFCMVNSTNQEEVPVQA
jgi:hypothetical protein